MYDLKIKLKRLMDSEFCYASLAIILYPFIYHVTLILDRAYMIGVSSILQWA